MTLEVSHERECHLTSSLLLCLTWISASSSKTSRFLHTQEPVCSNTVSSHPCQFARTKQAYSMERWPFGEVGITESTVPASPLEAIHLCLSLGHKGKQKAKALCLSMSGYWHGAAVCQGHGHVLVGDGRRKRKENVPFGSSTPITFVTENPFFL